MPKGIREIQVSGDQSLAQAVDDVDDCLRAARSDGVERLLIDLRGLTGFARPDLLSRSSMVRRWAATSQGRLKVAFVSRPELNDGERYDVVLAQALAFDGNLFEDIEDARHWLEQSPMLWTSPPPTF